MSVYTEQKILGVEFKILKSHPDDRGFFREIIRSTDDFFTSATREGIPFGQWSHSKMAKDVVKAWHFHHVQSDWWYVPIGNLKVVLVDHREESETYKNKLEFIMGEENPICISIPPGVLHGAQVVSEEAHLFYITSETYNPDDEGRLPYNSELVDHTWDEPAVVAENDKRTFMPTAERKLLV